MRLLDVSRSATWVVKNINVMILPQTNLIVVCWEIWWFCLRQIQLWFVEKLHRTFRLNPWSKNLTRISPPTFSLVNDDLTPMAICNQKLIIYAYYKYMISFWYCCWKLAKIWWILVGHTCWWEITNGEAGSDGQHPWNIELRKCEEAM